MNKITERTDMSVKDKIDDLDWSEKQIRNFLKDKDNAPTDAQVALVLQALSNFNLDSYFVTDSIRRAFPCDKHGKDSPVMNQTQSIVDYFQAISERFQK